MLCSVIHQIPIPVRIPILKEAVDFVEGAGSS